VWFQFILCTPQLPVRECADDRRNEQRALLDLPPDLLVPSVAAHEFISIEPHFDAARPQRLGDA
jgi:hypothetical protein